MRDRIREQLHLLVSKLWRRSQRLALTPIQPGAPAVQPQIGKYHLIAALRSSCGDSTYVRQARPSSTRPATVLVSSLRSMREERKAGATSCELQTAAFVEPVGSHILMKVPYTAL